MNIGILADSCCDLTPALRRVLQVEPVSLTIDVGGTPFRDDEALDTKQLLAAMKACRQPPHTACPSPEEYARRFEKYDASVVVTLSGNLSGSCAAARAGLDLFRERGGTKPVHILDSKSASAGQTLLSLVLRHLIDGGLSFEEVVRQAEEFRKKVRTLFVLEDLSNLVKNGRISRVAGLLGGALGLRPLMGEDGDGNIVLIEKVRGTQNAMRRLVATIADDLQSAKKAGTTLVLSYCNCAERALALKKELLGRCPALEDVVLVPTGGISTVYAYDGGIVAAYAR